MSYREFLASKGIQPVHIERTMKRGGDLVLHSSSEPVKVAPGRKGQFAGYLKTSI